MLNQKSLLGVPVAEGDSFRLHSPIDPTERRA